MKKIILCIIICSFALSCLSQLKVNLPSKVLNKGVKVYVDPADSRNNNPIPRLQIPMNAHGLAFNEHQIGNTWYDMQSNRMIGNRVYRFEDGTIGAVWTRGEDNPPDFPGRGTGYNYYDGTEWDPMPENRIESFRSGWPNYAALGQEGEIVVCHDFAISKLYILSRTVKGFGEWIETQYNYSVGPPNIICPRMITAGTDHNSIHVLAGSRGDPYLGQEDALVYSRSQDGGATWNIENAILDGTGSGYYNAIKRDSYVWADEKNGTIAFLCANVVWHDMFMMKSTDDGDTWEKTIIWQHPYPFYNNNTVTDTFFCVDGTANIALDSEGMAHVVFGISKVYKDSPGTLVYLDPYCDGIGYWNENMETFSNDHYALAPPGYEYANSEMIEDYNYIGWMQDVNGNGTIDLNTDMFFYNWSFGASTMPTIMINNSDNIFVFYSSTTETFEFDPYNFKHIWGRAFSDGEWHHFVDLTSDVGHLYDECIYPVMASTSQDDIYVHYIYHTDQEPGLAAAYGIHSYQENNVIYASIPKETLIVGIEENDSFTPNQLQITCYPNPFTASTTLYYTLDKPENVQFTVYNVQSQIVFKMQERQESGEQQVQWNAEGLPAGMYYYRLQTGKMFGSGKIMKLD